MCRMLAFVTSDGAPDGTFEDFRRLSHTGKVTPNSPPGHTSGWGVFSTDFVGSALHYRSARDAWDDPSFVKVVEVAEEPGPRSVLAHLRKASIGKPRPENSHPFVVDGRAFMHNGSIRGLRSAFRASRRPEGGTDSERFFLLLLDEMGRRPVPEAIRSTVTSLERLDYSSLTFVLQDGRSLYAYRQCRKLEGYYTLYYAQNKGSVIFSSEPLGSLRWRAMGNGELVHASLADGRARLVGKTTIRPRPDESVIHLAEPRSPA
ncbi:MAG TPA: class II glutamine amidotransferase [Conexivisphaerales archaeon]|nr:class II glutamine amidotransferase [Conexivisphaerales archaeon]